MSKQSELIDEILESMRKEVSEFVERESSIKSSSEYEESILSLSQQFAVKLIERTQGKVPKSRNSKKKY